MKYPTGCAFLGLGFSELYGSSFVKDKPNFFGFWICFQYGLKVLGSLKSKSWYFVFLHLETDQADSSMVKVKLLSRYRLIVKIDSHLDGGGVL